MAWDHLAINKPHLVYIILGGFTSLFMLCSSIIKERLYIGEATVATIVGVIFGPHAANLINPLEWGNTDQITLEFSRIVLVVQCFAVGVELPRKYMTKHWRSIVFLLVPVMTFGWLITSLFIWAMFHTTLNWLDSLCIAACVTATDPVLASSVVGKGKFAKKVPKHLRDILSAESGCNDGMAFPFIYLALYTIKYKQEPGQLALHWFCITILYECIFGCIYGVTIGYIARRLIRFAHEREYIDRESFLVFYFVLALFCAGSGSLLGMDDLLIGFAAGVGFSNDGWFSEKTEEAHVSNVIDLLLNLAFFVYFGTIIPWQQYNSGILGLDVWKLVVIAFLVVFFRRIPAMMLLKPLIPDIKTWREALFAGHFGPIGVGAIFVAILARADLEDGPQDGATPLAVIPPPGFEHRNIIVTIWPIVTFLVITSILVHGSSVAVFTLGRHINTLALTMSFSRAAEEPHWMNRLPRLQSRSKSQRSSQISDSSMDDRQLSSNMLPLAAAGKMLRRQKPEDDGGDETPSRVQSRSSSRHRSRRSRNWESGLGPGGPISKSAIGRAFRSHDDGSEKPWRSDSDTLAKKSESDPNYQEKDYFGPKDEQDDVTTPCNVYEEGEETVYEDKDGNVLSVEPNVGQNQLAREASEREEAKRLAREHGTGFNDGVAQDKDRAETVEEKQREQNEAPAAREDREGRKASESDGPNTVGGRWREAIRKMSVKGWLNKEDDEKKPDPATSESTGKGAPARAYQYGNTIIIENEDGEVIRKFDIPNPDGKQNASQGQSMVRQRMGSVAKMLRMGNPKTDGGAPGPETPNDPVGASAVQEHSTQEDDEDDDQLVRFTTADRRRMSKAELIEQFREMDPKRRLQAVEESDLPESAKREARKEARQQSGLTRTTSQADVPTVPEHPESEDDDDEFLARVNSIDSNDLTRVESKPGEVPFHDIGRDLRKFQIRSGEGETAAEQRRRLAVQRPAAEEEDSDDDGTDRVPPSARSEDQHETAAEKRRRLGALGLRREENSDSEDDDRPRRTSPPQIVRPPVQSSSAQERPARQRTLRWASNLGR